MGKPEVSTESPQKTIPEEIRLVLNLETLKNNGLADMIARHVSVKKGLKVTADKCASELTVKAAAPNALCLLEINFMDPRTGRLAKPEDKISFLVGQYRGGRLEFSNMALGDAAINKAQQEYILTAIGKFGRRLGAITGRSEALKKENTEAVKKMPKPLLRTPSFDELEPHMRERVMENARHKLRDPQFFEDEKKQAKDNAEEILYSYDDEYINEAIRIIKANKNKK